METEIITVNADQLNLNKIRTAVDHILSGEIVAFPTDTIYGIGCDMFNEEAIEKIYTIKSRPKDKPTNILISEVEQIYDIALNVPPKFFELAERFWPGALTIVVEKNSTVPDILTSGLKTAGVRMPNNNIILQLIKLAFTPLATTSANISEEESAQDAKKVYEYFNGKIPCILDGGKTTIGQPSTIIDISEKPEKVIRHGAVPYKELKEIIPRLKKNP